MAKQFLRQITTLLVPLAVCLTTCRQAYTPPAINNPNHYLVVDGFINVGPNTVTTFNLNRTRNLGDTTVQGIPELDATISIIGSGGAPWPLTETSGTGIYTSAPLTLDPTRQYSISNTTINGETYASSPVRCKITPPIA